MFVNKNVSYHDVKSQFSTTRPQWHCWFALNNSFNTTVTNKSYAQVLKDGKSIVAHKERIPEQTLSNNSKEDFKNASRNPTHYSGGVLSKCVRSKRTPTHYSSQIHSTNSHRKVGSHCNSLRKEYLTGQEPRMQTSNRFHILASTDDLQDDHSKEVTCENFDFTFRGNKNKTGPILGTSCHTKNPDVDVSQFLAGNKNKTGKKLGVTTRESHHDCHINQKACLQFRGNNCLVMIRMMLCK